MSARRHDNRFGSRAVRMTRAERRYLSARRPRLPRCLSFRRYEPWTWLQHSRLLASDGLLRWTMGWEYRLLGCGPYNPMRGRGRVSEKQPIVMDIESAVTAMGKPLPPVDWPSRAYARVEALKYLHGVYMALSAPHIPRCAVYQQRAEECEAALRKLAGLEEGA